jgi:hypothetical protein
MSPAGSMSAPRSTRRRRTRLRGAPSPRASSGSGLRPLGAQEAGQDEDADDRLVPGPQRCACPRRWQRGGADGVEFRECVLRILVHAPEDKEVGGDAGVGGVVPIQRSHTEVKANLLAQEGDVGGDESDEERRPGDCAVDPGGADRPSSLALGEHGRGAIRRGVPSLLSPCSRAVGVSIDGVDRQPLGNVVRIALGESYQHAGNAEAGSRTCQRPRRLSPPLRIDHRLDRLRVRRASHRARPVPCLVLSCRAGAQYLAGMYWREWSGSW